MLDQLNGELYTIAYIHGDAVPKKGKHYKKLTFNLEKLQDRKLIFLFRDPRDTVISAYYDAKFRDGIWGGTLSSFIRHNRFGIKKILAFHQLCYENMPSLKSYLVLKYEALHANTFEELRKSLDFAECPASDEEIIETIDFASFQNMKKMESDGDFIGKYSYTLSPGNPSKPESFKVRKGKIGGYLNELSKKDIAYCDHIMKTYPNPFYKH